MKNKYWILLMLAALPLLFLMSNPSLSLDVPPVNVEQDLDLKTQIMGKPYSEARATILSNGWSPVENAKPDELVLNTRDLYDQGYVEVGICSPVGEVPCKLYFKSADGKYLEIATSSEAYLVTAVNVMDAKEFEALPKL